MENASKALLMAAEVLIGILILTLAVYLINVVGKSAQDQEDAIYSKNLTEFNAQFTKYETPDQFFSISELINRENHGQAPIRDNYLTSADVVSLINLVQEQNNQYASDASGNIDKNNRNFILVIIDNSWRNSDSNLDKIKEKSQEILNNSTKQVNGVETYNRYYCKVNISEETAKVNQIIIIELNA